MDMPSKLLLLLPLLIGVAAAAAAVAQERNIVTHVKGYDGPLPFSLETGYVEVEERHGVELFYYFIQSERNPQEDPLILWVSGGPSCSSVTALFYEFGPLRFDVAASYAAEGFPRLVHLEESWTKVSNVIFLDAPVGTGFSYARDAEGLNVTLTGTARRLRVFLEKWVAQHPEFASNPLYIGGDSYSGKTVTVTAMEIANHPGGGLNLTGYITGNGAAQDRYDIGSKVPYMHGMGLISDELYQAALGGCRGDLVSTPPANSRCANALQAITHATSDVNPLHILEPTCGKEWGVDMGGGASRQLLAQEADNKVDVRCRVNAYRLSYIWADDAEVREALGVREGTIGSWKRCTVLPHFRTDVSSAVPYHRNLTRRGYRALVYNGDHDVAINIVGTQAWIRSLGYPVLAPWRPWYDSNRQLAGFTTEHAYNLTFVTVLGAGHMAAEARPKQCLDMLHRWTSSAGKL